MMQVTRHQTTRQYFTRLARNALVSTHSEEMTSKKGLEVLGHLVSYVLAFDAREQIPWTRHTISICTI